MKPSVERASHVLLTTNALLLLCLNAGLAFDRNAAVKYANKFWGPTKDQFNNNVFQPWSNDCANFVSQSMIAGNIQFDLARTQGDYVPDRTIVRANELASALLRNQGVTLTRDFDTNSLPMPELPSGDVVFLMGLSYKHLLEIDPLIKTHATLIAGYEVTPQLPSRDALTYLAHSDPRYHYPYDLIELQYPLLYPFRFLRYLHIPNSPIIKYMRLYQVNNGSGKMIHEYRYDSDYDPAEDPGGAYYENTYNGLTPTSVDLADNVGIAQNGKLFLTIIFDTAIDAVGFSATIDNMATPGTPYDFATVRWDRTHQDHDTWVGELMPPMQAADIDGSYSIRIDAYAPDGSEIDSDGALGQYSPGPDLMHKFILDTKLPQLTLMDSTKVLLDKVEGVHSIIVHDKSLKLTATDATSGIRKVTFARLDPSGSNPTVIEYDPPKKSLDQISLGPLTNGIYKLELLDAAENTTSVNVQVILQTVGLLIDSDFRAGIIDTLHEITDATTLGSALTIKANSSEYPLAQARMFSAEKEIFNETNFQAPLYFEKLVPGLSPGNYTIMTKDTEGHSMQAAIVIGSYLVEVSTQQSMSSYRTASKDFIANIHVKFQTSLGLDAIKLHGGAPDFRVLQTIPQNGQFTPIEVDFASLVSGQYYAVGKATNGEFFGLDIDLADNSITLPIPPSDPGALLTNMEVTDGRLHLARQQTRFAESGTYTSAVKEIVDISGAPFLGGVLEIRDPMLDGCVNITNLGVAFSPNPGTTVSDWWKPVSLIEPKMEGPGPSVTVSVRSADVPSMNGTFSTVFQGNSYYDKLGHGFPEIQQCPEANNLPIGKFLQYREEMISNPRDITIDCGQTDGAGACLQYIGWPAGFWSHISQGKNFQIRGQVLGRAIPVPSLNSTLPNLPIGAEVHVNFPGIGDFTFYNVSKEGHLNVRTVDMNPPANVVSVPPNTAFDVITDAVFERVAATFYFDPARLTQLQKTVTELLHFKTSWQTVTTARGDNSVSGEDTSLSPFMVVFPESALNQVVYSTPTVGDLAEASLISQNPALALVQIDTTTPSLASLLRAKTDEGLILVGGIYGVNPEAMILFPAGQFTMHYASQTIHSLDVDSQTLALFNIDLLSGTLSQVSMQNLDTQHGLITTALPQASGLYAIFGRLNDRTPPSTQMLIQGPSFEDANQRLFLSSVSLIGFVAADSGTLGGRSSAVSSTLYLSDPSPGILQAGLTPETSSQFNPISVPTLIPDGYHILAFGSIDGAGNFETMHIQTVVADSNAPSTELLVLESSFTASGIVYIADGSSIALQAVDSPSPVGLHAGAATTYLLIDHTFEECNLVDGVTPLIISEIEQGECLNPVYSGAFALPIGTHAVSFFTVDNVANRENIQVASVTVRSLADTDPPSTTLTFEGSNYTNAQANVYISSLTGIMLSAQDYGSSASGFDVAFWVVDPSQELLVAGLSPQTLAQFSVYTTTFTLSEGVHALAYGSRDFVGNYELLQTTTVYVDGTPPDVALTPQGSSGIDEQGRLVVSSQTPIVLTANDPEVNGVSAGVKKPWFLIDKKPGDCILPDGNWPDYDSSKTLGGCKNRIFFSTTTFTLSEGSHTVRTIAWDRVGNTKGWQPTRVDSDSTPPVTTLSVQGSSAALGGMMVVSSQTYIVLAATDPVSGGVNAGVMATLFLLNRPMESCDWGNELPQVSTAPVGSCDNPFYSSSFSFTTEGTNTLGYLSLDKVANIEELHSTTVILDSSPPSVAISSPVGGETFVAGRDSITVSFAVLDNRDVAPVFSAALVHTSGSSVTVANGQTIDPASLLDGSWELRVSAVDFVQNSTIVVSGKFEVIRDILPPRTSLVLGQPSVFGDPAWVKSTTLLTLEAVDDAVTVGDAHGMGVARTSYSVDALGASLAYSSAGFHLSGEGSHPVAYRSVDVLGHVEEVKVSSVAVDETPPTMAFTQPAANAVLNTATPIIQLSYSDAGSGIDKDTFTIAIDGVPLSVLADVNGVAITPLVGQGPHAVTASIADRLGNRQSVSLSFFVDSISPQATITRPSNGSYVNLKRPTMEGVASDYGSGLNTSSITMSLDGSTVAAQIASPGGPGIPGPWTETRALPTGLWGQASAVWNGYLYVAGGGGNFPGYSAEVKYAAINADGTLGTWQTGASLPRGLTGHKMVAAQGRLFVLGGLTAANVSYNEAYVSVIDPVTGQPGAWAPSRPLLFANGAVSPGATVVGKFIYVMGGYNPYCQVNSQVYYAEICPGNATGLCTSWNTTSSLPTKLDQMDAISMDGVLYIYAPGGIQYGCSNTPTNQVYSAKQNPNGTLTTWTAGAPMRRAVARYVGLGAEGHIYVLGGTSYVDPVATVDFAAVDSQSGAIGQWTEDAKYNLPIPLMSGSGAVWDGRLFVLGGQTSGAVSAKVYSSLVRAAGIVTVSTATYTPTGDLAEGEHTIALSAADKAGNLGQAQATRFNVDTLPPTLSVSIDGRSPGSDKFWVNVARPQIVLAYSDPGGAIPGSGVDVASLAIGIDGVDVTASADKDDSGARFTPQSDFSQGGPHALAITLRDRAGNAAYLAAQFYVDSLPPQVSISTPAGNVYLATSTVPMASVSVDGGSGLSTDTVKLLLNGTTLAATLSFVGGGGGQGIPEPWQTAGSLPDRLWGHASAVWNGFVYVSGGGNTSAYQSAVKYAPIQGDGSISAGSWLAAPSMARGLTGHKMVAAQGRIFTLGGLSGANVSYNEVYVATINVNGSLSGWSPSESLGFPYGTVSMGVSVLGDYIYAMGGYNPYCQVFAQVYYAKICPQKASGLCTPWQATTPLPTTLDQMDAVTVDGALYIYVPGGVQNGCSNSATNRVWYGKPNKDTGAVAQWNETAVLPRAVSKYVGLGAEGHIYVLGGTPSVNPVNTVDFAAINQQSGALEPWTEDVKYSLPVPLHSASGVVWEGRLYVMGGQPGDGTISNTIYSSLVGKGTVISATAAYTASVAEGQYSIHAQARDLAGNVGSQDAAFTADWTPPISSLVVEGSSRTYQGRTYIPGQSVMRIGADDAVAGVKESRLRVDSGEFVVTAGTFTLTHGNHELTFYSLDRANNTEANKVAAIRVDGIAPAAAADLVAVIPSTTGMTLAWTSPGDDGVEGVILSGEFRVQYASLPTAFEPTQAQIVENVIDQASGTAKSLRIEGLAPGTDYTFALWTKDTAGNYSAAATASARTLSLAQSADQVASIISPEPLLTVSTVTPAAAAGPLSVSTTQGLGALTATFYELNTGSTETVHFSTPAVLSFIFDRTGVDLNRVAIYKFMDEDGDGDMEWSTAPIVNQTLTQLDGDLYQITGQIYSASLYGVFEKRDILPPRTTLALGEPKYVAGETYLTAMTDLSLSAADDRSVVGDGDGAGVSGTQYALDGGAAALYTTPVRLSGEGPHDFAFFSVDLKNNLEARQSRRLVVDGTPPVTTVSLSTPSFEAFVSPLTTVKLSAQDPLAGTVPGSGLNKIIYAVGAGQLGQGSLEFGLQGPDGKYELSYQAQDNLGNQEILRKNTYSLDSTPAVSVADVGAHSYSAPDGKKYVSPLTPITLSAQDQTVNEVASGVQLIAVDLGQGYAPYTAPLTFIAGHHQFQYRATDKVGNMESAKSLELYVDGTAPATLLSYDGYHLPRAETTLPPAEAEMFIMPQTKLILTAQDPGEIASGVGSTEYRLDEGAWVAYSAPFSITADGLHTLAWRSKDRVDNEEASHSLKIDVIGDILPPRTAMQVGEPKYIASRSYVTSRTELILSAIDDRLAVGDALGVGVDRTEYAVDEGASARYSAPVKLSGEGPHAVGFFSVDLLGHVETTQSQSLSVDDAPPATLVSLSTPSFGMFVSPLTTVKLSAQDPASGSVPGSGLAKLLYVVGSGPMAEGVLEFGLVGPDGNYELNYQAQDNLGNLEPLQKIEYSLDGTPPLSASAIGSPSYTAPDGKKYVSPLTPVALSAQDPAINEVASGLKRIEVDLGQGFATYQGPLSFSEGIREPRFRSLDNVGNMEIAKSLELYSDGTTPITAISYDGFHLSRAETVLPPPEAEMFVLPETKLILTAQDPGELASGVGVTEYRLDEGAWLAYSAPFSIAAEGLHTLAWRSRDRVANEEVFHSLKIAVINDILPPRTAMQVGEPKYFASRSYVTSRTELTLSAIDDRLSVGDGVGLGVDRTEYSVDGGVSARYSAPVKLSGEGPHVVNFFSVDVKDNVEAGQDQTLAVDDAPPQTTVALSTPSFGAYVSPLTVIKLTAQDPASGSVPGSGLAKLLYAIGAGQLGQGPVEFGLVGTDGNYELSYQAQDNLGNQESLRKNTYSLDSTPPLSASAIGAHSYQAPDGKLYVSPVSQVALSATDPLVNEVASGIKLIEADLGQGYAPYTAPLTFTQGHRQFQYRATDNVGNIEQAKSLELHVDGTVPVTAISYGGFHLTRADNPGLPPPEAEEFISPQTKVILTAQDPGTETVSGVKLTEYRLDDGAWIAYSVPFSITAEGLHTLAWRSKDQVDNEEATHSVKLGVMGDIQPPRTVMSIGAPKYVAADTYLTSATELTLTAVDDRLSVGDGLGLGVEKTEYSLDAGVLARYTAPIKLSGNGPHNVAFFSTDVLGHAEASQARRLLVDDAPPITEIVLSGLRFTAQSGDPYAVGGPLFIASTTLTALQAQDPLVNGSASGLASLSYGLDTTALGPYSAAFTVTPQGAHSLKYLAVDNLGNAESLKTLSFSVDAAAPVTQISFTGPYFMQSVNSGAVPPEAEVFIARETRIVLTAHDPVVAETASGVGEIRYRIDGGEWLAYSQSLAILSGGLHALEWYAKDRLGLEEAVHSLRIAVDVAAPISSLSIGEPRFLALGLDFVTPQTPIALSAIDLPNSGIAVGVQGISYRIDAGAELLYTASFTLAQGTHTVEFWAYDRAGNVEYRQSRLLTSTLLQTAALTGVDGITGSGTAQVTGKLLSNGRVALSGSVRVLGDAAGSPVALTGNASVSGIVSQNGAGTMPEPIDLALAEQLASAASSNALIPASFMKDGALVVTGNKTLLLATGTYVLKGLTLSGGASLEVAGPVRLFLDGPLQVGGGAKLNAGGTASSLVLFAKSGSIALSGGAQAVGLFYAPRSSLGISGNARIGGALFAKSVAITGDSNVIAAGEVLPPELIASGGTPGKGGKTADFSAGGILVAQGAADPSFQLRDLYAFPNPAVGGAKPVIHAAVGIADRVVVKIFDVSGRQTKEATLDGSPQILDDGSGPKYAYEYTWDGHIPSGVYFYTIEAEKSGQKIRKAGKLSVVR